MKVFSNETFEAIVEKQAIHNMGINDFCFGENEQIVTCSSDRSVKVWAVKIDEKTVDEVRKLGLSEEDDKGLKDNVEKQQLGCLVDAQNNIMSVQCNSDINVWNTDSDLPFTTIRGHSNSILKTTTIGDNYIVAGD